MQAEERVHFRPIGREIVEKWGLGNKSHEVFLGFSLEFSGFSLGFSLPKFSRSRVPGSIPTNHHIATLGILFLHHSTRPSSQVVKVKSKGLL